MTTKTCEESFGPQKAHLGYSHIDLVLNYACCFGLFGGLSPAEQSTPGWCYESEMGSALGAAPSFPVQPHMANTGQGDADNLLVVCFHSFIWRPMGI